MALQSERHELFKERKYQAVKLAFLRDLDSVKFQFVLLDYIIQNFNLYKLNIIRCPKILQMLFELILRRKAVVGQIAHFSWPFLQISVIEQLNIVADDKRNDVITQTFLEHGNLYQEPAAGKRSDQSYFRSVEYGINCTEKK